MTENEKQFPAGGATAELILQKSRFLGLLQHCDEPTQARELLRTVRAQYKGASHVVHAFVCSSSGSEIVGCSDDGEPSGTAGRPLLDALRSFHATETFLAVIRWFGGVKLGTGGLSRAYAEVATSTLAVAKWQKKIALSRQIIRITYADQGVVRRILAQFGAHLNDQKLEAEVMLDYTIPMIHLAELEQTLLDATHGRVVVLNDPT